MNRRPSGEGPALGTSRSSSRPRERHSADLGLLLRFTQKARIPPAPAIARQRQLIADLCRLLGAQLDPSSAARTSYRARAVRLPVPEPDLSPRMRQTLQHLLAGDSEKQIASRLHVSAHTIHVYVKAVYERLSVTSRGELLARYIQHEDFAGAPDTLKSDPAPTAPPGKEESNGRRKGNGVKNQNGEATNASRAIPEVILRRGHTAIPPSRNGNSHEAAGGLTKED